MAQGRGSTYITKHSFKKYPFFFIQRPIVPIFFEPVNVISLDKGFLMIIFRYSTGIVKSTITIPDPRIGPPPDIGELPQENFIGKSNF